MTPARNIPHKVRRMFRLPQSQTQIDTELGDEFRFHIEGRIEQFIAQGMSRAEAEREVRTRFGDYRTHWQHTRNIDEVSMRQNNRFEFIAMLRGEIQHSVRALRRSLSFSVIAVVTLALGIGATTAIYSVLDSVVLRPLPYFEPNALVSILHPTTVPGNGERKWGLSAGGYFQFKNNAKSLSNIGAYRTSQYTVTNGGKAEPARVALATSTVFTTFRARAEFGRLFVDSDDQPGMPQLAVLSHEYFESRFGGDRSIIGKNLETSAGNYEIIGVTEPGLTLPTPGPFASQANLAAFGVDVWLPMQFNPAGPFFNSHGYVGIGRLRKGMTVDSAQAELMRIAKRFPDNDVLPTVYSEKFIKQYNFRTEVSGLRNAVLGPTIPRALWMVLGSVLLVMLIASANVANLFIVRMETRRRESAIRTALGASGQHMAAHYLSESMLLCGIATVFGLMLAYGGLRALLIIAPTSIPRLHLTTLSWHSLVVAIGIALTLGVLLGLMPMLRRFSIAALREGGRGLSASPRQRAIRSGLVIGQVALALVLVAAAGLMLQSFVHLRNVKPGFDVSNVTTFDMSLPFLEYDTREKALTFHRELQRQILEIPGVKSVGTMTDMPLEGFGTGCSVVFREGIPYAPGESTPCVTTPLMGPGLLETFGIPVTGEIPSWHDVDNRTQAVVVTKALADRIWPGESPIGKGISSNGSQSKTWYRVVGVISNFRGEALDAPLTEAVFYAVTGFVADRRDDSVNDLSYFIKSNAPPTPALMKRVSDLVVAMNPRVPVTNARSMEQVLERSMARTSFVMVLLGVAALVALTLSAVGMYGVISYLVAQRRAEIGIRIALGAGIASVARLIMWQSVRLAVAGVSIGLVAAFLLGRTMNALLFGVSASDPRTMATVSVLLLTVAAAASFAPSRRASKIDPLEAMRTD